MPQSGKNGINLSLNRKLLTSDEDSDEEDKEQKPEQSDQEDEPTKEGEERAKKLTKKKKKKADDKKGEKKGNVTHSLLLVLQEDKSCNYLAAQSDRRGCRQPFIVSNVSLTYRVPATSFA